MQIQNFDPGMSFLRPMATAQEMDIRLAQEGRAKEQHPLEMKRLSALTEWDVTRAAEKRTEMESDANLARYLQDYKPSKEGLPYEEQLGEMSAGLIRQGKVNEAKKLADLSVGMENVRAMAEQRQATAEMRRVRAQKDQYTMWNQTLSAINEANVGDVLARVKQQGMPEEDLAQYAKMAQTPQGRETIRKMALQWKDTIAAEQRGAAQVSEDAYRKARLAQYEAGLRLEAEGVKIRQRMADVDAYRASVYGKTAGSKVPEVNKFDLEQAQSVIRANEEFLNDIKMTPNEARNFAYTVAARAEVIWSRNREMGKDVALAKAFEESKAMLVDAPDGTFRTWMAQIFGDSQPKKKTFMGPRETLAPAAGGLPPGWSVKTKP